MATLNSPGVSVTVVNESFYTPAAPGTVPLMFVASASNKTNPSGVTAPGTIDSNAGKVYLVTSQRDLADTFGIPLFYTDANGNPIHGGELNEYGLQAAYSLLGVSSAAYIVRAPVDLSALTAKSSAPAGNPTDGSYWLDTANTVYGIFEWNKTTGAFVNKTPLVINDSNKTLNTVSGLGLTPAASTGVVGAYAVVSTSNNENSVWYKNSDATWVKIGTTVESSFVAPASASTFASTCWATSWPTIKGTKTFASNNQTGELVINGTTVTVTAGTIEDLATAINAARPAGVGAKVVGGALGIYADSTAKSNGTTADGKIIISSTNSALLTEIGIAAGTYVSPTTFVGPHTQYPDFSTRPSGSIYVKTTSPNSGQIWTVKKWSETNNVFSTISAPVYANGASATYNLDKTSGGAAIPANTLYVESNFNHGDGSYVGGNKKPVIAEFKIKRRVAVAPTTVTSPTNTGTVTVSTGTLGISVTTPGVDGYTAYQTVSVAGGSVNNIVTAINNSGIANISATVNGSNSITITHATGGEIRFNDPDQILANAGFSTSVANFYALGTNEIVTGEFIASNWEPLTFTSGDLAPSTLPANGTLWYSSVVDQVDIMVHDGSKWVGYANAFPDSDPNGPIVSATKPTRQSDGTALANGDIWISTANIEDYGKEVYVYNGNTLTWVLQDVTDQTTPNGWIFADARWATSGAAVAASSIKDLRSSNYVDPDAPDPALYPRGIRLWNLRRSGFNVKEYVSGYINPNANNGFNIRVPGDQLSTYNLDRWVSVSPNNADGSGTFGRLAQRGYVVSTLKATIDGNVAVRDTDTLNFNLLACPGYVETLQNLVGLNTDRGLTAFVVGDTPFRLKPNATELKAWGLNSNGAFDNGDKGAVSYNEYMAMFYPSGYTNDLSGNYVVVPPSHMMLRTIALSDQKSYPWFAPAGIRRGVVDNATSVGYVDGQTGEFKSAALPQNLRDVMASIKVNPIATITGAGIINFGQYTRANAASALDRINVARLVCHIRRQLDILARPFLFEPNDKITRNEIRNAAQSLLLELVGQRALYDFIVVCDESNNTPARIDRSELWLDIAIEPVKAVEFIYIPLRLVNTGEIQAGTFSLA